jgi:hypothetical protein
MTVRTSTYDVVSSIRKPEGQMICRAVIIAVLAASACGHKEESASSSKPSVATCDALVLASVEARGLREQVGGQLASVGHVLDRADRLKKNTLPPEEAGTDNYTGAIQRAYAYKQTGFALCRASLLVDSGMLELAMNTFDGAEVRDANRQLERVTCEFSARLDTDSESSRAAAAEWSSQSRDAREFEERVIDSCYSASGAAKPRPTFHVSASLLQTE